MTVPLLRLIRLKDADGEDILDADGRPTLVEVRADVADVIEATEPGLKERLLRKAANIEKVADPRIKPGEWEGLRVLFTHFLGESRTWPGPNWRDGVPPPPPPKKSTVPARLTRGTACDFCKGMDLDTNVYCTRCDRTGRDYMLKATPKPKEPAPAPPKPKSDGLAGGRGDGKAGKGKGKKRKAG